MSRIKAIEVQTGVLQTRKHGFNDKTKNNEDQPADRSSSVKVDSEKQQIKDLLQKLPKLAEIFDVHRKVGEGTFSSVYLGSLKQHSHLPEREKRWFAIKHLVPTAHPNRIEHELRCLRDMGGKNNVIGVDLCLRHMDSVAFVMPYIPHKKFSEYVTDMDAEELRQYMKALLEALKHVHSFGVIHRDIKPSNFLYDRENRRYLLVDFGLAQRILPAPPDAPSTSRVSINKRPREELYSHSVSAVDTVYGKEDENMDACEVGAKRVGVELTAGAANMTNGNGTATVQRTVVSVLAAAPAEGARECACAGQGGVCGACGARVLPRAPRAGTQGFRPPEVLLKYERQTTAVDVWAAGVVLCSALCGRYPLLRAADDAAALAELAALLGARALRHTAQALGRRLVMSRAHRGLCVRRLCARLRGATPPPPCAHCRPPARCLCRDESRPATDFDPNVSVAGFPDAAFALVAELMNPDPHRRITAAQALTHPFIQP